MNTWRAQYTRRAQYTQRSLHSLHSQHSQCALNTLHTLGILRALCPLQGFEAGGGHLAGCGQAAAAGEVALAPGASLAAGREALDGFPVVDSFQGAVNPAEAKGYLYGVLVADYARAGRRGAVDPQPEAGDPVVVLLVPAVEFLPGVNLQQIGDFHTRKSKDSSFYRQIEN